MKKIVAYWCVYLSVLIFFIGGVIAYDRWIASVAKPQCITVANPYGYSSYNQIIDEIRCDIEKVVHKKYFIIYSWISSDQSGFDVHFVIENIQHKTLVKEAIMVEMEDDKGNKYKPMTDIEFRDDPEDMPLGYRKKLIVRFEPLDKSIQKVSLTVQFGDRKFYFDQIPVP